MNDYSKITAPIQGAETATQGNTPPTAKTAHTAHGNGTDGDGEVYKGNGHCIYSYQIKMSKTLDISSLT